LRVLLKQFLISVFILCAVSTGISSAVKIEDKGVFSVQASDNHSTYAVSFDTHDTDFDAETLNLPALPSKIPQSEIELTASAMFIHTATQAHIRAPPFIS
jgi:hypothetical protein